MLWTSWSITDLSHATTGREQPLAVCGGDDAAVPERIFALTAALLARVTGAARYRTSTRRSRPGSCPRTERGRDVRRRSRRRSPILRRSASSSSSTRVIPRACAVTSSWSRTSTSRRSSGKQFGEAGVGREPVSHTPSPPRSPCRTRYQRSSPRRGTAEQSTHLVVPHGAQEPHRSGQLELHDQVFERHAVLPIAVELWPAEIEGPRASVASRQQASAATTGRAA